MAPVALEARVVAPSRTAGWPTRCVAMAPAFEHWRERRTLEGLEPALDEVTVERTRHRPGRVLDKADPRRQLLVARQYQAADDIGVTSQVLGRRMYDGIGTEGERC